MSSNPFRRSRLPDEHPPSLSALTFGGEGSDGAPLTPPLRTKKKRVQIQTPPHSPALTFAPDNNEGRRLSASDSAGRAESPPPPASAFEEHESESDSTATADSELEEAVRNSRRNSGSLAPQTTASANSSRAPFNPFARTLATSQPGYVEEEPSSRLTTGRPAMDVESFKNILLTGSAVPSPPSKAAVTAAPPTTLSRPQDSSSSTDTSSIFDPGYTIRQESPRTSFDDYDDRSSDEDDQDDEHSNLMGEGRLDDLAPPAPPKPKLRGPQTVSFADFDQSIPPDFQNIGRNTPAVNAHMTGILRPSVPRSTSDLNKPLPAPPQELPDPPPSIVPMNDLALSPQVTPTGPTLEDQTNTKKVLPPPPPPTRRKAGESGRLRSASNSSNNAADSSDFTATQSIEEPAPAAKSDPLPPKLAPPPPPSRKLPHANPQSSETSSLDTSPNLPTNEVSKPVPAPPPRRQPSKAVRGENSSRVASDPQRQMKPGDAFLAAVAPHNAPPAPPPRRGGSKRSSMDEPREGATRLLGGIEHTRRGSRHSVDSPRSTSISSLQHVPAPAESDEEDARAPPDEPRRDILADLSAFQAEIDALRAQSEGQR